MARTNLTSRLTLIAAGLSPRVDRIVERVAEQVAQDARDRVPTGPPDVHLRDHIRVKQQAPATYAVVAGDDDTFYAHMVEYGTSHSAPHPFLVPALEQNRALARTIARRELIGL